MLRNSAKTSLKVIRRGLFTSAKVLSAAEPSQSAHPATKPPKAVKRRRRTHFSDKLNMGPSFADFVSGRASEMSTVDPIVAAQEGKDDLRMPPWLRVPIPKGRSYRRISEDLKQLHLSTVCHEARCPNISECWGGKRSEATATIMLMGDTCTRGCRFCSVKTSRHPPPLDPKEPVDTARAISRWGLGYVVLTTVDRDDLPDGGSRHLLQTVVEIKKRSPSTLVEVLSGDMRGNLDDVKTLALAPMDVYAHNMETVEALTPYVRDRRATYRQSLKVLRAAKEFNPKLVTKSSLMLGFGETDEQVMQTLRDLRKNNVDVVTFGQYMRPTRRHVKVVEYVRPEKFDYWKDQALKMGFLYCASAPLVRSSYKAGEAFIENVLKKRHRNVGVPRDQEIPNERFSSKEALKDIKPQ